MEDIPQYNRRENKATVQISLDVSPVDKLCDVSELLIELTP